MADEQCELIDGADGELEHLYVEFVREIVNCWKSHDSLGRFISNT